MTEEDCSSNGKRTPSPKDTGDAFDFGVSGARPVNPQPAQTPPPPPPPSPTSGRRSRQAAAASYEPTYEDPPLRRPKSERTDTFNATLWLIEGVGGLIDEIQHNDLGLPEEFWMHAYAARKEGLLAARALIDHAIQRSDEELTKAAQQEEKRTRRGGVEIDFES